MNLRRSLFSIRSDDPDLIVRGQLLKAATLALFVVGLFFFIPFDAIPSSRRHGNYAYLIQIILCLAAFAASFLLSHWGRVRRAGALMVLTLLVFIIAQIKPEVLIGQFAGVMLLIPIMITGLYLSSRFVMGVAFLAVVGLRILAVIREVPWEQKSNTLLFMILMISVVFWQVLRMMERALSLARAQTIEVRHAKETMEQQHQRLMELREAEIKNQMKTKFLANMSHELRTPLNAIINFTDRVWKDLGKGMTDPAVLANMEVLAKDHQRLGRVIHNASHLLDMINDILDLAKIESGKMELFPAMIDVRAMLQSVMSTAIGLVKDKPAVRLHSEIDDAVPALLLVDKTRFRQVVLNLLSNAAKFTEEGHVTLRARVRHDQMVEISVEDTGIGIAPENHALVFEEFRQVEDGRAPQYQGTGLGLPISKRLVEMHGGTMWLESAVGKGATFFFTIPLPDQLIPAADASRNPQPQLHA